MTSRCEQRVEEKGVWAVGEAGRSHLGSWAVWRSEWAVSVVGVGGMMGWVVGGWEVGMRSWVVAQSRSHSQCWAVAHSAEINIKVMQIECRLFLCVVGPGLCWHQIRLVVFHQTWLDNAGYLGGFSVQSTRRFGVSISISSD